MTVTKFVISRVRPLASIILEGTDVCNLPQEEQREWRSGVEIAMIYTAVTIASFVLFALAFFTFLVAQSPIDSARISESIGITSPASAPRESSSKDHQCGDHGNMTRIVKYFIIGDTAWGFAACLLIFAFHRLKDYTAIISFRKAFWYLAVFQLAIIQVHCFM